MLVAQIVKAKASSEVYTIAPHAPVATAVSLLAEKRIGAVVVSSDGAQIAGILSERDIVRALAQEGPSALTGAVSRLMTVKIETCAPSDQLRDVAERMTKGRFRHMPVLDDGRMVAVISIGDVVKWRLDELAMQRDALQGMIAGH